MSTRPLPSGAVVVSVPNVSLPEGWNKPSTEIRFVVPAGYPYAALDCFWADSGLRLADGRIPNNTGESNPIPEDGGTGLWFSWHLQDQKWNPNRDTLSSWMNVVISRFRHLQ
ncbi:hypothetical protein ISN39_34170 (plasmid) [Rhizobium sp. 007]|nr:hypothetical protein ISN39_34170 [Rhizobium sp. 007]